MATVIKAIGYASGAPCHFAGQYLEWYDPDVSNPLNQMAGFTSDPAKAKRFADAGAAMAEWNRVRSVDPVRPDGKPNKPLTAITVVLETISENGGVT